MEVGRVYFGVVYIFDVEEFKVIGCEEDIVDVSFEFVLNLFVDLLKFESWL